MVKNLDEYLYFIMSFPIIDLSFRTGFLFYDRKKGDKSTFLCICPFSKVMVEFRRIYYNEFEYEVGDIFKNELGKYSENIQ